MGTNPDILLLSLQIRDEEILVRGIAFSDKLDKPVAFIIEILRPYVKNEAYRLIIETCVNEGGKSYLVWSYPLTLTA